MATINRYSRDSKIALGTQLGTPLAVSGLRTALKNGTITPSKQFLVTENDRLDTLAGAVYGDASMWWVLAAASGIGWGMQVPPGTVISVLRLEDVKKVIG
jgi:hypothetical protein